LPGAFENAPVFLRTQGRQNRASGGPLCSVLPEKNEEKRQYEFAETL